MFTANEKKVLREILFSPGKEESINGIARNCGITPNGAYKILKKLEREGILKKKKAANISFHEINFESQKTRIALELALMDEPEGRVKHRAKDFEPLKEITEAAIIFGSYTTEKEIPEDIDMLFVLEPKKFREYKKTAGKIFPAMPAKPHDVLQTISDLKENIKQENPVILGALKKGIILWGHAKIIEAAKK